MHVMVIVGASENSMRSPSHSTMRSGTPSSRRRKNSNSRSRIAIAGPLSRPPDCPRVATSPQCVGLSRQGRAAHDGRLRLGSIP
jgi:hypothetical protein